ncbi:vascular endothelial growth factor receptor 1 isoform X2 [Hydra vulgaris]|uniref:receptor protein-tyrosine kinase n=1 Tax=Hydra vulgaris TaxID=6087 RepID=A0ABM4D3S7_HYDVU
MFNIILLCFFISFSVALPSDGVLKFLTTKWVFNNNPIFPPMKFVYAGYALNISCKTNDPDAEVTLYRKNVSTPTPAKYLNDRLTVVDQIFYISSVLVEDGGTFSCEANNGISKINLILGDLKVSKETPPPEPEIFPKPISNTIEIEFKSNKNITCKSAGARGVDDSYLNWYKEDINGMQSPVDKSKIVRLEEINNIYIDVEILMFTNFQFSDFGKYVCTRKEPEKAPTSSFVNVVLKPSTAPTVTFPQLSSTLIDVDNGRNGYQVQCEVNGSPKPKMLWKKNNEVFQTCDDDDVENKFCYLYFQDIAYPRDEGEYTCIAENEVGEANKSIKLQVLVPIEIKKPSPMFVASFYDDKEIHCDIENGNPLPIIKWQFARNDCSSETECNILDEDWTDLMEQTPNSETPTNFSYIISKKSTTNMIYKCIATNGRSEDTYQVALMRSENVKPEFSFGVTSPVNVGDRLNFTCEAVFYVYISLTMTKDKKVLLTKLSNNSRATVLEYDILSADISDSGTYQCIAKLKRGGQRIEKLVVHVKKLLMPSIGILNDRTISQDTDRNIMLMCNSSGNPPPLIEWTHNSKILNELPFLPSINSCNYSTPGFYKHSQIASALLLCKTNYERHQGTFQCIASNKVGLVNKTMKLTILAKPYFHVEWKSDIEMISGTSSELDCSPRGYPPSNVTWLKFIATNKTQVLSSKVGKNQYIISKVSSKDSGMYKCSAVNIRGRLEKFVTVKIKNSAYIGTLKKEALLAVVVPAVIILIIALIAVFLYRRHLKNKYARYLAPDKEFVIDPDRTIFEQSSELPYDLAWEFPREKLTFIKALGSGAFGQVWLAEAEGINSFRPRDHSPNAVKLRKQLRKQTKRYHSLSIRYQKQQEISNIVLEKTMVAVKTLKDGASESEYKDLASELKILIHLGEHKNIVNLLGACTTKGEKLHVILECCPGGDLLNFLRSKKVIFQPIWFKKETSMENEFTYIDLILIAHQVANGMEFLQSRKCVHRDLAARNVLIGVDYIMKIADFGLARDIFKNDVYMKDTQGLVPVKWMAPESLFDKVYTSSSDVWSYGVLLWEIFSLGAAPYPGLPLEELFSFLEDGHRMASPEHCPESVYEIMLDCWRKSPYDRPLFSQIGERLSNILKQNVSGVNAYIDLKDKRDNDDYLIANELPHKEQSLTENEEDDADLAFVETPLIDGPGHRHNNQFNTVL